MAFAERDMITEVRLIVYKCIVAIFAFSKIALFSLAQKGVMLFQESADAENVKLNVYFNFFLQCYDTVGWATGRSSGL